MFAPLEASAPAKINLSLEVLGRREDGFHELVSVMQTISLVDSLTFESAAGIRVQSSVPELDVGNNLVERAARLLRAETSGERGCSIQLEKRIPVAAGLGGGSSDAAATLAALNELWHLGLDCGRLAELAARLGSDVPFFLWGGTALVGGRGERVSRLPSCTPGWYVLARPEIEVSTAAVFEHLPAAAWTDGARTLELAAAIEQGEFWLGPNGLAETLFHLYPAARRCFAELAALAQGQAMVSGSGPTILGTFSTGTDAEEAASRMRGSGYWAAVAAPCTPETRFTPCA